MKSIVLVVALMFGLAACGSDGPAAGPSTEDASAATPSPTSAPAEETREPPVPKKLGFTAKTLKGGTFDGAALAGKDSVLWFWAPWCTECRREAPHVAKSQAENGDVIFVGVAGLGESGAMRDFVKDYRVGAFEHLADLDGSLWKRFGVVQQPAYAFIDDTGKVEVIRGELGADGIAKRVATLTSN